MRPVVFSPGRAVQAEGARVGLVTCGRCGCALLLDAADETDVMALHVKWHDDLDLMAAELGGEG